MMLALNKKHRMARMNGPIKFIGNTCDLCFYKSRGRYFARSSSKLRGKRVKKDQRFAHTMANARVLGRASAIASKVYRSLPECFREGWMYRAFTGEAIQLLRSGEEDQMVYERLWQVYVSVHVVKEEKTHASVHISLKSQSCIFRGLENITSVITPKTFSAIHLKIYARAG